MKLVLATQTLFLHQGGENIPVASEVLARFEGPNGIQLTQNDVEDPGWIAIDNSISLLASQHLNELMRTHHVLFFNLSAETLGSATAFALWLGRLKQMTSNYPRRLGIEISNRNLDINNQILMQRIETVAAEPVSLILDNAELSNGPSAILTDIEWKYCKINASDLLHMQDTQLKQAIDYCRRANIHIVADRVETPELLQVVNDLRIPFRQGFELDKPHPVSA